jgi:hypothetical protein
MQSLRYFVHAYYIRIRGVQRRHHPLGGIKSPLASVHNADKSGAGWKEIIKRLSQSLSLQLFPFSQKRCRRRAVVDFSGFNISKASLALITGEESCAHRGNSLMLSLSFPQRGK